MHLSVQKHAYAESSTVVFVCILLQAVPAQLTSYLNSKVQAGTITFAVRP